MAAWRSKGRPAVSTHGRSGLELYAMEDLRKREVLFDYEAFKIPWIEPPKEAVHHTYKIDFVLRNGIGIETKGRFSFEDQCKMLLVIEQHPDADVRMIFDNPKGGVMGKGGGTRKLTNAEWCDQHGVKWAAAPTKAKRAKFAPLVPQEWIDEPLNASSLQAFEAFRIETKH